MSAPLRIYGPQSKPGDTRLRESQFDAERGQLRGAPTVKYELPLAAAESPYAERLVKLIPAEVVALYLFGTGAIPADAVKSSVAWAVTCLMLVVIARAFTTRDVPRLLPPQWTAVILASISFVIWIFTMPGPLQGFGLAPPFVGSLVMATWTFLVPYFYKG